MAPVPIGTIAIHMGKENTIPNEFIECRGQDLSCKQYSELYTVIRGKYGYNSEQMTFKVPDMRGQFIRGCDHGRGLDPDADVRLTADGVGGTVGSTQESAINLGGM